MRLVQFNVGTGSLWWHRVEFGRQEHTRSSTYVLFVTNDESTHRT
jgi:hypothetical protein